MIEQKRKPLYGGKLLISFDMGKMIVVNAALFYENYQMLMKE